MASTRSISFVVLVLTNLLFATVATAHKDRPTPLSACKYYPSNSMCPKNVLKFGVCEILIGALLIVPNGNSIVTSKYSETPCCTLVNGLSDLDAAVSLCNAIKAGVLNVVRLDMAVSVELIFNKCRKKVPYGFKCGYSFCPIERVLCYFSYLRYNYFSHRDQ